MAHRNRWFTYETWWFSTSKWDETSGSPWITSSYSPFPMGWWRLSDGHRREHRKRGRWGHEIPPKWEWLPPKMTDHIHLWLVGGDWNMTGLWLSIQLGMSYSQLTLTPSFFRGVGWNHQPFMIIYAILRLYMGFYYHLWRGMTDSLKIAGSQGPKGWRPIPWRPAGELIGG